MKTLFAVPVAALAAVGLIACGESPTESYTPQFELVDESFRIAAEDVNAHVYGSFSLWFDVSTPGGVGVIISGPASFPGNAKNAGTCDNGLWINSQGKRTSGSVDKPHPHCVGITEGGTERIQVVLEPISAKFTTTEDRESGQTWQRRLQLGSVQAAEVTGGGQNTEASGIVVGYAIDASTLGSTNHRVGKLTFNMAQYHSTGPSSVNYFDTDCAIDDGEDAPRCLDLVITAEYEPLPGPDGVGETTANVTGFLYWAPATAPFNYGSD